jgi:pilus assembly protein CpaC
MIGPAAAEEAKAGIPVETLEAGKVIIVQVGRSVILKAPWRVTRVSVTDPEVADVQVLTPDQVLLMGKELGSTDVILWSAAEEVWQSRVDVDDNLARVKEDIARFFPDSRIELTRTRDVVIIRGLLARAEHAEQLHKLLEAAGYRFVDMTSVAGVHQVQIQVRVAEVSRSSIRSLGVNFLKTGSNFFGASTIGSSTSALQPISIGPPEGADATSAGLPFIFTDDVSVSPLITMFGGIPGANLQVFLQALAENQYVRVLAEPNLVAMSGEEANFLAGGEFPIPVVQGATGSSTSITIEYREFGVRLRFRPIVLGDGTIRLEVEQELSDLSQVGAVEIQGFRVPALTTRRAETTLELKSGQTFSVAGLLSRRNDARNSRIPLLGDLPILGTLFRSVRYQSGETDLVLLVTPSLIEPVSAKAPAALPGSDYTVPGDWSFYVRGEIEGRTPWKPLPPATAITDLGLERLHGPGAWADYEQGSARSQAVLRPSPSTVESPAPETPAVESPGTEPTPPADAPKAEAPVESPKAEAPPAESPKIDAVPEAPKDN